MERDTFRMKWLLPRAERLIADLSPDVRADVIDSFGDSIPASRCHPVVNTNRPGVFKYRVGRNLRVCFRLEEGLGVVVFIGSHHECRIFVDRDGGEVTGRLIPIKESMIMSMNRNANDNKPGSAAGRTAAASQAEQSPSFSDWMRMLPGVIDRTYGQKVRQVEDVCLAEMDGVTARIEGVRAEVGGVTARIETLGERFDSQHQEVSGRVATLSREVNESNQRTHSVRHDSQTRVAALAGDLAAIKGELNDQGRRSTEQVDSVFLEVGALSEKLDSLSRSVVEVGGRYQDLERTSNNAIDAIRGQLTVLEARDQAGPLVALLTQHGDRLDSQDRAVQGALQTALEAWRSSPWSAPTRNSSRRSCVA